MKALSKEDNPHFRKLIKRDALVHFAIMVVMFVIVFLIPFLAYLGKKYNF